MCIMRTSILSMNLSTNQIKRGVVAWANVPRTQNAIHGDATPRFLKKKVRLKPLKNIFLSKYCESENKSLQ